MNESQPVVKGKTLEGGVVEGVDGFGDGSPQGFALRAQLDLAGTAVFLAGKALNESVALQSTKEPGEVLPADQQVVGQLIDGHARRSLGA